MQALSEAGGISQVSADASEIYVIREVTDNSVNANVYHLDASNPIAMLTADSFNLMPRDIVFVGTPDINRFNRVINQILPSFTLYRTLDRLSNDLGL